MIRLISLDDQFNPFSDQVYFYIKIRPSLLIIFESIYVTPFLLFCEGEPFILLLQILSFRSYCGDELYRWCRQISCFIQKEFVKIRLKYYVCLASLRMNIHEFSIYEKESNIISEESIASKGAYPANRGFHGWVTTGSKLIVNRHTPLFLVKERRLKRFLKDQSNFVPFRHNLISQRGHISLCWYLVVMEWLYPLI